MRQPINTTCLPSNENILYIGSKKIYFYVGSVGVGLGWADSSLVIMQIFYKGLPKKSQHRDEGGPGWTGFGFGNFSA